MIICNGFVATEKFRVEEKKKTTGLQFSNKSVELTKLLVIYGNIDNLSRDLLVGDHTKVTWIRPGDRVWVRASDCAQPYARELLGLEGEESKDDKDKFILVPVDRIVAVERCEAQGQVGPTLMTYGSIGSPETLPGSIDDKGKFRFES